MNAPVAFVVVFQDRNEQIQHVALCPTEESAQREALSCILDVALLDDPVKWDRFVALLQSGNIAEAFTEALNVRDKHDLGFNVRLEALPALDGPPLADLLTKLE